jgi:hypothetical protein
MTEFSRKDFLRAVVPGAWALDLKKGGGLGGLPPASQVGLVKDVLLITGGAASLVVKEKAPASFKQKVEAFSWGEAAKEKELAGHTDVLADEYLRLTGTTRIAKRETIENTHFLQNRAEFINAVKDIGRGFTLTDGTWGATNFPKRQVYIDTTKLKEIFYPLVPKGYDPNKSAGRAFLQALWHEWGRLDVAERTEGRFLNDPKYFFEVPGTGRKEPFRKYIGGAVFTDTYFGYTRFESVWNNSIAVRRMSEQVDLDWVYAAGDYDRNGTDIFTEFTKAAGISIDTLYQMHATSDFEGFMDLVGQKLPGNTPAQIKGERLFTAIHRADPQLITQTGALTLLPKSPR